MTVVHTLSDHEAACAFAAAEIAAAIERARSHRGVAHVSLAGGNTPRRAYELLAPLLTDWSGVELWYGDERCVRPEDPDSNHRMVADSLLAGIAAHGAPPPLEQRIRGEFGPEAAARDYDTLLRERVAVGDDGLPALDLSLLGLGPDGHTASLFPGHPAVDANDALALPVREAPKPPPAARDAQRADAARRALDAAARHRRRQGAGARRGARRPEPGRSREPARGRTAAGHHRHRRPPPGARRVGVGMRAERTGRATWPLP